MPRASRPRSRARAIGCAPHDGSIAWRRASSCSRRAAGPMAVRIGAWSTRWTPRDSTASPSSRSGSRWSASRSIGSTGPAPPGFSDVDTAMDQGPCVPGVQCPPETNPVYPTRSGRRRLSKPYLGRVAIAGRGPGRLRRPPGGPTANSSSRHGLSEETCLSGHPLHPRLMSIRSGSRSRTAAASSAAP